jgi:hypothetical protein
MPPSTGTSNNTSPKQNTVRFSRFLRLRWVVALGVSISVGMNIFILLGVYIQAAGRQSLGAPFLLMTRKRVVF